MLVQLDTQKNNHSPLLELPADILKLIFKDYLKPEERIAVQFVNKKFFALVSDLSKKTSYQ